ncbi:hypothetical protein BGCPKDLD_4754 [Methylorubrum suomiense]|uniref:HTH cro/C1-type domain-containing protein n=1 Tax=Methylorubrum suomiense TaxID=144191 RepID=A0ABQ4V3E0_9HYPH|nr:hypothetical protein BGCPKDLD_4754 [Methylorubrum suomiense]
MSSVPRITELLLKGYSVPEIVEELGKLKASSVKVYVRRLLGEMTDAQRAAVERARDERGSAKPDVYHRKFSDRPVLGPVHVRIGHRLLAKRQRLKMSHGEFCEHFEFSNRVMLSAMEQGYHDFKISEVLRIAEILEVHVDDLLCPPAGRMAA